MAGETAEIKGSRRSWYQGNQFLGERLFGSVDGSTDVPARGDDHPDDAGLSLCSRRKCLGAEVNPEVFPGMFFARVLYANFVAYS